METTSTRYEQLIEKLRQRKYRLTPQRLALIRLLADHNEHLSASQIYERMKADYPTMSPGTIYKTLTMLKEMGEVLELGFGGEESHFDVKNAVPHPHLVCIKCHRILDHQVDLPGDLVEQVSHQSGFRIVSHRLDFFGLCPDCQESD